MSAAAVEGRRHGLAARRGLRRGETILLAAMVIALLTEGIGAAILSFARDEIRGSLSATVDEFAWLSIVYLASKALGFLLAPWACGRLGARDAMAASLSVLVTLLCMMTLSESWAGQMAIFTGLGLGGGVMVVSAQALLFQSFATSRQPGLQMLYALGTAFVATSVAPGMMGTLVVHWDWRWICAVAIGTGLLVLALLHTTRVGTRAVSKEVPFDMVLIAMATVALFCFSYVATQGQRWNWFEAPRILAAFFISMVALVLAVIRLVRQAPEARMLDLSAFSNVNFAFLFLASFAAGFALSGTGYLVPAYAAAGLGMNSAQIGQLLLGGAFAFVGAVCLSAFVLPRLHIPLVASVPVGLLCLMASMWLLAQQARGAGVAELMPAILLRSGAIGFLLLSIALIALSWMPRPLVPHGSALIAFARQLAGFVGTGYLGTVVAHQTELNSQVLGAHLSSGDAWLASRIAGMTAQFAGEGMSAPDAAIAAMQQIGRQLAAQAAAVAWNRAFLTVALFFFCAAPVLIAARVILGKLLGSAPEDAH